MVDASGSETGLALDPRLAESSVLVSVTAHRRGIPLGRPGSADEVAAAEIAAEVTFCVT